MGTENEVQLVETRTNSSSTDKVALPAENARVPLPPQIAHLTLEQQNALEKRVVRKMDFRLMPILILM
jgi:hypothetical protein